MAARFLDVTLELRPGRVFTPRATTEPLVRAALERIGDEASRVADIGTGSGAIAVSLAWRAPNVEVWASDTSTEAVALAEENARAFGVADRVHVGTGDLLLGLPRDLDLVLANLPYLPDGERDDRYAGEPPEAVYGPGDGLEPYRRLLAQAAGHLTARGAVIVQLHGEILEAERHELPSLAARLEWVAAAA
jgi:release factor glutamine methyltransferase